MTRFDDATFERIGAYLDGELTMEDRAQVEALLADSESHRELLHELRALREQFEALPRIQPSANLTDRIMASVDGVSAPWQVRNSNASAATLKQTAKSEPSSRWTQLFWGVGLASAVLFVGWVASQFASVPGRGPKIAEENPKTPENAVVAIPENHNNQTPNGSLPPEFDGLVNPDGTLGPGFVFDNAEADIMLVQEFAVDNSVIRDGLFEKLLAKHGIAMKNRIIPDPKAEEAILDSQTFGGDSDAAAGGDLRVSIVVADVDVLWNLTDSLNRAKGVLGSRADLSIQESDKKMISQLARVRDEQIEDSQRRSDSRAYVIAFRDEIRSALLGSTAAILKLENAPQLPNGGSRPLAGKANIMPAVFILRAAPEK